MSRRSPNLLVICSDQHSPHTCGWRGHRHIRTPNLDRLASRGTHFTRAYCNSPICTPSRMSFITGLYPHQIASWTIGCPLDPEIMTWPRHLRSAGIETTMLGKMDFCGDYQDGGFSHHRILRRRRAFPQIPLAEPWPARRPGFVRWKTAAAMMERTCTRSEEIISDGVHGEAHYELGNYDHDRIVTNWTTKWLREKGASNTREPWVLYVGLLYPHPPFTVPDRFFEMYYPDNIELPRDRAFPNEALHPAVQSLQETQQAGKVTDNMLRRTVAAYYGMVTSMDEMIGEILDELELQGLADDTLIIYTSDHGESLGTHGLFFKKCAYEESVGVPLIVTGPGVPAGHHVEDVVSLIDLYPTVLDVMDVEPRSDLPGSSWLPLIRGEHHNRLDYAFSEYHGPCFRQDWYMIRRDRYKYVEYQNERPSLFDLETDPGESHDLAGDPACGDRLGELKNVLHSVLDPHQTSLRAKGDLGLLGPNGEDYTEIPL